MKKVYPYLLISFLILVFPVLVSADGGMVIWPPTIHLDQSAQNAIVAWNGNEEIIILSIDLESSAPSTVLRIIPLPSNPSEIKEGSFDSFEKLVEIMNEKIEETRNQWLKVGRELAEAPAAGVEITFHKKIGAHDITVVKVNNLDYFLDWVKEFTEEKGFEKKEISSEFREGVANYLKRDIKYFVFDVIETGEEKESIKPLIYRFESDFLYYPLLISGISEIGGSRTNIDLFLITKEEISSQAGGYTVELTKEELEEVSKEVSSLFKGEVKVAKTNIYERLSEIKSDLILFHSYLWDRNLTLGSKGMEVKALQQILINAGSWESNIEATGYFGPITKSALAKFQEQNSRYILKPVNLETGTGYFGSQTRDYFKRMSLSAEQKQLTFERNLSLGTRGDDIKALQEILIKGGVWERPDVKATGYFGSITREAVIKYQEKYASEILEPLGLVKGTGFVGSSTRSRLEKSLVE